jgi:TRAP-type C4-dicarboxylate transport system permease small subunit
MKLLSKAYDGLIVGLAILAGLMLVVIFVGIIVDVAIRTVGYNSLQWYSAIAEYCLLFSTMLAAPWLVRLKGHVVVESLTMAMPAPVRWAMAKAVYVLCIVLCLLFVYYGFVELVLALGAGELDLRSIDMPKWILFLPFPLGFTLVAIEFGRYLLGYGSYYTGHVGSSESL